MATAPSVPPIRRGIPLLIFDRLRSLEIDQEVQADNIPGYLVMSTAPPNVEDAEYTPANPDIQSAGSQAETLAMVDWQSFFAQAAKAPRITRRFAAWNAIAFPGNLVGYGCNVLARAVTFSPILTPLTGLWPKMGKPLVE
jgi:hypothetical protein